MTKKVKLMSLCKSFSLFASIVEYDDLHLGRTSYFTRYDIIWCILYGAYYMNNELWC